MLNVFYGLLIAAAFLGAVVSWFVGAINMFRAVANRKEGVPLFPHWYEGPASVLFKPHQLTERGLVARRRCFGGLAGFLVFCAIMAGLGSWSGLLH